MAAEPSPELQKSLLNKAKAWGENSVPPTLLATLVTAQHLRPFQGVPMLFPPVLLFTTYFNLRGYKIDAAGLSAAWSGLYLVMARRRKQKLSSMWSPRGIVRGMTMGLCAVNIVGGGVAYALGRRSKEQQSGGSAGL